jgi:hypothetical protein
MRSGLQSFLIQPIARLALCLLLSAILSMLSVAQSTGGLHGTVSDPSGAVVVGATVAIVTPDGKTVSANTAKNGTYQLSNLAPGKYTVTANAQGFAVFVQDDVDVPLGQPTQFNISLQINVEQQKVEVQENTAQVDVNPANNAGAIILSGKDLDASPTIPTNCKVTCRLSRGLPRARTVGRFTSMDSPGASFHPSLRFAKSASTRILFPPNSTSSAMAVSRSSPSPAPTSGMARFP